MIKQVNKIYMWYKVNELKEEGLNKSQIARKVGLYRGTVRKYLSMTEEEYHNRYVRKKETKSVLNIYEGFVKKQLDQYIDFSAAQIEDRLKDNFTSFPQVNSKTIYNFVNRVREKYGLEKPRKINDREYQKIPECDYGHEAQVDFGEMYVYNTQGERIKVYFFAMVLSRSRQKFVYFQNTPFTSATAIYAHDLAFEFYKGVPKKILYDQDRVFMVDENLGDLILTAEFKRYCDSRPFHEEFCRKADPETKGKVENVVKYVKNNFLKGRTYVSIDSLNKEAFAWLNRTGNAKIHGTTKKIPMEEWQIEKEHLLPFESQPLLPEEKKLDKINLLKDNTVLYKSNYYTVPTGTFKGKETPILREIKGDEILIYNEKHELIAQHKLSIEQGKIIRNTDHARDKSQQITQLKKEVLDHLGATQNASLYLEELYRDKPRYYRDNLLMIKKKTDELSQEIIQQTIKMCLDQQIFNGKQFGEIAHYHHKEHQNESPTPPIDITNIPNKAHAEPETSNINTYQQLMEQLQ